MVASVLKLLKNSHQRQLNIVTMWSNNILDHIIASLTAMTAAENKSDFEHFQISSKYLQ